MSFVEKQPLPVKAVIRMFAVKYANAYKLVAAARLASCRVVLEISLHCVRSKPLQEGHGFLTGRSWAVQVQLSVLGLCIENGPVFYSQEIAEY